MVGVSLRLRFDSGYSLGPGKIRLLELIRETGSISAAGRHMGMSYNRAWSLVRELNDMFERPLVERRAGGLAGGGAYLTRNGAAVVHRYRAIESAVYQGSQRQLRTLGAGAAKGANVLRAGE